MNREPAEIKNGKYYRLWLQFEGGEATSDPKGVMSSNKVTSRHAEMVGALMNKQPNAVTEDRGLVLAIMHLEPNDTTALLWVSEA